MLDMAFFGKWLIAGFVFLSGYLFCQPPSLDNIYKQTNIARDAGSITFNDVVYTAEWGEQSHFSGLVRDYERAYYEGVPFITHNILITNGDFSDPDKVRFSPLSNGSTSWRADAKPTGSAVVLHVIPENPTVFEFLKEIDEGDQVKVSGFEEKDHRIDGSDGSWQRFSRGHNHVLLLATEVEVQP